jgi:hypothetical protein
VDRRSFLLAASGCLVSTEQATGRLRTLAHTNTPWITLVPRQAHPRREIVNVGVPFAPGQLVDAARIHVVDEHGAELDAAVRPLEHWRHPPDRKPEPPASIRAVQLQLHVNFSARPSTRVRIVLGAPRARRPDQFASISDSFIEVDALQGPAVLALTPPAWLCESEVAGPQTPSFRSGRWSAYDRLVDRHFPESLQYVNSDIYHHWLFDRTSVYYKQYVRTGDRGFLEAAYHCATFLRLHTEMSGPDAGFFTLKGPDVKYVYPRAMHLHYLMTGDERALEAGKVMARYCLTHWDPVYRPGRYSQPGVDVDPEKDRPFWSTRHEAYGLLGVLHGWEMTGDETYWLKAREYVDALASHQAQPPDGFPPDGSWRQNWALYDPSETLLAAGASPWMTAILLDALFHYWWTTRDARIPEMVTRWCDFLDRKAFTEDGSRVRYIVDCLGSNHVDDAPGSQEQGMERHSTELAYSFAMGQFFSRDPLPRARFRRRFDRLFDSALRIDMNRPVRCYNWAFQASSQLVYFMNHLRSG